MRRLRTAALLFLAPALLSAQRAPSHEATLDAFIAKGMQDWKIPGLSVVVVKGDSVVYLKGFGVRRLGGAERVDTATLFGMMSTTKAMTALAVAMLVDSGKVAWNDPVTKHLPWFQLSDPHVTRELRVRDLLTHNAGLGNADLLWDRGDLSTRQVLERVRGLPMAYSLRSSFIYQNVMYQAAGEVVAVASGMPWAEFVARRIMAPIGMTRSHPTLGAVRSSGNANVSAAHWDFDEGGVRAIDEQPVDVVPAAGAAWSSAADVARWVRFWIDSGRVNGRRLISEASFRELLKPQSFVTPGEYYPTAQLTKPHWVTYGLGWFEQDYRGRFVAMHTGSIAGRTAIFGFMPDERLGVYVFGNLDHAEFRHALMWRVFDLYTAAPARDWNAEFLKLYGDLKARAAAAAKEREAKRVANTTPSTALAQYAGTYAHPVWGDMNVALEGGALVVSIGQLPLNRGRLEHWHYDTFRGKLGDGRGGWTYVTFRLGASGAVAALRIEDSGDFEFTRLAASAPPADSAFSASIEFQSGGVTLRGKARVAAGAGPHQTVLRVQGFPGTDETSFEEFVQKNGINGVSIHFRGQLTSDGRYRIAQTPEDVRAALAYLRTDSVRRRLRIDLGRIAVLGSSAGSLAALQATAAEPAVRCVSVIVPFNWGIAGVAGRSDSTLRQRYESTVARYGTNPQSPVRLEPDFVTTLLRDAERFDLRTAAPGLSGRAVFLIGARDDQTAPMAQHYAPLLQALRSARAMVRDTVFADGHNLTNSGEALYGATLRWLQGECAEQQASGAPPR